MKKGRKYLYTRLEHEMKIQERRLIQKYDLNGFNLSEELLDRYAIRRLVITHNVDSVIGHGFNAAGERIDNLTHVTLVLEYSAGPNLSQLQGNRLRLITAYPDLPNRVEIEIEPDSLD